MDVRLPLKKVRQPLGVGLPLEMRQPLGLMLPTNVRLPLGVDVSLAVRLPLEARLWSEVSGEPGFAGA